MSFPHVVIFTAALNNLYLKAMEFGKVPSPQLQLRPFQGMGCEQLAPGELPNPHTELLLHKMGSQEFNQRSQISYIVPCKTLNAWHGKMSNCWCWDPE